MRGNVRLPMNEGRKKNSRKEKTGVLVCGSCFPSDLSGSSITGTFSGLPSTSTTYLWYWKRQDPNGLLRLRTRGRTIYLVFDSVPTKKR